MTREEFLGGLRGALSGNISAEALRDNLDYYDRYIIEEMQKGKSEEEVTSSLGDPWIIAKTIIDASDGTDETVVYENAGYTQRQHKENTSERYAGYEEEVQGYNRGGHSSIHYFGFDTWWKKLLLILSIVLVVVIVVALVTGIISLLAPIVIPIVVIMLIIRIVNGNGRR